VAGHDRGGRVAYRLALDHPARVERVAVLDVLPTEEAVAFLLRRAQSSDEAGARILAAAVDRLPLALGHAAATCRRTQMRFADYAAEVAKQMAVVPRGAAYPKSVAATFDLAIREAAVQCPGAEGLMGYLAWCAPERIPMMLIEGGIEDGADRLQAPATLVALADVSLVRRDPFEDGTPAVTVHRLVQAVARVRSAANGTAQGAARSLVAQLSRIYPEDGYGNPESWPLCARLTPHLLALREANSDGTLQSTEWPVLLNRAGGYLYERGAYAQAEPLFRDMLAAYEKDRGPEHPDTAAALNNLAMLRKHQGDLAGARPLYERALAIRKTAFGPAHPETAASLNNLAGLLHAQGDLAGARPLYERALAIYETALGPEQPGTATALNNLALLLHDQRDLAGARSLYERALAIREKALGPENPHTATSLNNLALLLQDQGDLAGARPLHERALAIREKALGPEHPRTATSLNNLASLLRDQGDLAGARPLYERALAIREKALGPEHPDTNRLRCNLARLMLASGQPVEALRLGEAAVAAHERMLGPKHPWTSDSARVTAEALDALGRGEGATALRTRYGLACGDGRRPE
jgi:tetratricopeptide (TPR) repeat protein